jgi:hypothetical protein
MESSVLVASHVNEARSVVRIMPSRRLLVCSSVALPLRGWWCVPAPFLTREKSTEDARKGHCTRLAATCDGESSLRVWRWPRNGLRAGWGLRWSHSTMGTSKSPTPLAPMRRGLCGYVDDATSGGSPRSSARCV